MRSQCDQQQSLKNKKSGRSDRNASGTEQLHMKLMFVPLQFCTLHISVPCTAKKT